jgi:hypothetical protein
MFFSLFVNWMKVENWRALNSCVRKNRSKLTCWGDRGIAGFRDYMDLVKNA